MGEEKHTGRNWPLTAVVFVMLSLCYGCWYLVSTIDDAGAHNECVAVVNQIESEFPFPPSVSTPGRPALFCHKGIHGPFFAPDDQVIVYGVIDGTKQDAILAALARTKQQLRTRRIVVSFYEKENWITWSDPKSGRSGGDRAPEKLIRKTVIP